jgi:tetratricopeptide (TPR) repeat protein
LRCLESLKRGKYESASKDIEAAQAYPLGLAGRGRIAQFNYILGLINRRTGNATMAEGHFNKTVKIHIEWEGPDREYLYYQGLALKELGKTEECRKLFQTMLDNLQNRRGENTFFTQFEGGQSELTINALNHYLFGLAYEGLGDKTKAKAEFAEALNINPGHIWSKVHLDSLQ